MLNCALKSGCFAELAEMFASSDDHGYENPCGFTGTGVTGTGAGDEICTRDLPVPVWAGDGSVTRSHQGDVSTFSTPHQRDANVWTVATTRPRGKWEVQLRGGRWAVVPISQSGTCFLTKTCIGTNKTCSTTGIAREPYDRCVSVFSTHVHTP